MELAFGVPASTVRDIIGASGAGLKEFSREFNCRVFIDKGEQADGTRLLHIIAFKDSGEAEVNLCRDAVQQLVRKLVSEGGIKHGDDHDKGVDAELAANSGAYDPAAPAAPADAT